MRTILLVSNVLLLMVMLFSCTEKTSEKEYFDLASQYMDQQDWQQAEENFAKVLQEYPNGLFSSKALFMVGYLNANHMKNYDKAKEYYTEFLEKYPDHELAEAAKYELEHMGKEIDDLPFLIEDPKETALDGDSQGQNESSSN